MDKQNIEEVMNRTGSDFAAAEAALNTSDGDVEIAVRIIRSYDLKQEAEAKTSQEEKSRKEDSKHQEPAPEANEIIDAIKDIWKRGNASQLDIEKNGRKILSLSLVASAIGLILAPVAAIIGLGSALITEYTVKIILDNGTVININDLAIERRQENDTETTV